MKEAFTEFKKLIVVLMLNWSFQIMPDGNFKTKYARFIKENLMDF
jgi:hypothetical protein